MAVMRAGGLALAYTAIAALEKVAPSEAMALKPKW
jgi:hypothetical protein